MTTQTLKGRKYSGDLYGREYGSKDGFVKMGNVSELKTSTKSKTDTLPSTGREDYGQAISSEITPEPTEISLAFNSFDKKALARMLMGEAVDLSTGSKQLTDVSFQVANGWIDLGHLDIDENGFTIEASTGGAIDKDTYTLNTRLGLLQFNEKSKLQVGETVNVTAGKTKGTKGFSIDANTLQDLKLELRLDGKDRISGKDGVLIIPHAVLSAKGDINWFDDKWWEAGFDGVLVKDDKKPTMRFTEYE